MSITNELTTDISDAYESSKSEANNFLSTLINEIAPEVRGLLGEEYNISPIQVDFYTQYQQKNMSSPGEFNRPSGDDPAFPEEDWPNVASIVSDMEAAIQSTVDQAIGYLPSIPAMVEPPTNTATAPTDTTIPTLGFTPSTAPTVPSPSTRSISTGTPPVAPSPSYPTMPTTPSISFGGTPSEPSISLPTPPTSPSLNYPATPAVNFLTIDGIERPSLDFIESPDLSLDHLDERLDMTELDGALNKLKEYREGTYEETFLDLLVEKYSSVLNSATDALGEDIEDDIFNRDYERMEQAYNDAVDKTSDTWAKRGLPLPDGALAAQVSELSKQYMDERFKRSREISEQMAKMAFEYRQFAMQQGLSLEDMKIKLYNSIMDRALRYALGLVEMTVSIYQTRIAEYQLILERYKTMATVYREQVQAELAKLEIYKVDLEAIRIGNEAEKVKVDLYLAQLEGLSQRVKLYTAEIDAVGKQVQIAQTRTEIYRTQVAAYGETVRAELGKVQVYEAQVKGMQAQTDVEVSKMQGYSAEVQGYKAEVDAKVQELTAQVEADKLSVEAGKAQVDAWAVQERTTLEAAAKTVEVERDRVLASFDVYSKELDVYSAEVSAYRTEVQAETDKYKAQMAPVEFYTTIAKLYADTYPARINASIKEAQGLIEKFQAEWVGRKALYDVSVAEAEMGLKEADFELRKLQGEIEVDLETAKANAYVTQANNERVLKVSDMLQSAYVAAVNSTLGQFSNIVLQSQSASGFLES